MSYSRCYLCGRTTLNGCKFKTYVGGRVLCKARQECRQIAANCRAAEALNFQWLYRPSDVNLFRTNPREFLRRHT